MESTKWQHRSLLNFSPPKDTVNVQLHIKQFTLKEVNKLAEQLLHIERKRNTYIKTGRNGES